MKKSTVLSLTTAAVILAAYVPNEVILADTPSSEDSLKISDKETVIGKQNENKEKLEAKTFTIATPANIRVYILFGIIILFCLIL